MLLWREMKMPRVNFKAGIVDQDILVALLKFEKRRVLSSHFVHKKRGPGSSLGLPFPPIFSQFATKHISMENVGIPSPLGMYKHAFIACL